MAFERSTINQLVRMKPTDAPNPPYPAASDYRWIKEGDWIYFVGSPFIATPYAQYFPSELTPVPVPAGPPADFIVVFGPQPVSQGALGEWQQDLALWKDGLRPSWVDDIKEDMANELWLQYGAGKPTPYRLTNGAELVVFKECDPKAFDSVEPKGFTLPASLAYGDVEYGIALYQARLILQGVTIAEQNRIPYLQGATSI